MHYIIYVLFIGETDWKVLVINVEDPIASEVNGKKKTLIIK